MSSKPPEKPSLIFRLNDNGQGPELLQQVFLEQGWTEYDEEVHGEHEWNMWWRTSRFRTGDYENVYPWQRLNHYPKSTAITKKDALARNMKRMRCVHGSNVYNFSPLSFNLPNDYTKFVKTYGTFRQKPDSKIPHWICKPADLSRGRGIFIFRDLSELLYDCNAVIQQYIDNPLLIGGYKFDLRIYVAVTSFHPLTVYIHEEGIVRFSTEKFDLSSTKNIFAHLTNTSINKHSPGYTMDKERVGPGCKWTLTQLRQYFLANNINDRMLWKRIVNIVVLTLLIQAPLVPKTENCFELYGFDILVDQNLKPWLLEVNFSPSLSSDCLADVLTKKPMLHDLLYLMNYGPHDAERGGPSFVHSRKHWGRGRGHRRPAPFKVSVHNRRSSQSESALGMSQTQHAEREDDVPSRLGLPLADPTFIGLPQREQTLAYDTGDESLTGFGYQSSTEVTPRYGPDRFRQFENGSKMSQAGEDLKNRLAPLSCPLISNHQAPPHLRKLSLDGSVPLASINSTQPSADDILDKIFNNGFGAYDLLATPRIGMTDKSGRKTVDLTENSPSYDMSGLGESKVSVDSEESKASSFSVKSSESKLSKLSYDSGISSLNTENSGSSNSSDRTDSYIQLGSNLRNTSNTNSAPVGQHNTVNPFSSILPSTQLSGGRNGAQWVNDQSSHLAPLPPSDKPVRERLVGARSKSTAATPRRESQLSRRKVSNTGAKSRTSSLNHSRSTQNVSRSGLDDETHPMTTRSNISLRSNLSSASRRQRPPHASNSFSHPSLPRGLKASYSHNIRSDRMPHSKTSASVSGSSLDSLKKKVGSFHLVFPFNEVTWKAAHTNLDAKVVIREAQLLLKQSLASVSDSKNSATSDDQGDTEELWGPLRPAV